MKKETKKAVHKVFVKIIKDHYLVRLGVYPEKTAVIRCILIIEGSKLNTDHKIVMTTLLLEALDEIASNLSQETIDEIADKIKQDNISPVDFVNSLKIRRSDLKNFLNKEEKVTKIRLDSSIKEVGQRVTIAHPLFTNMLVTSEGVQIPCKSFDEPAIPELMNKQAIVIETDCKNVEYFCGQCNQKHSATTKIAFEEFNMEFFIYNDFLNAVPDEE